MVYRRTLAPLALFIGCSLFMGCTSSTPTTEANAPAAPVTDTTETSTPEETVAAAVNTNCPIMGKPVTATGGRTEWNGQTIGFCCPKCIDKWEALPEDEKTSHLTEAGTGDHAGH